MTTSWIPNRKKKKEEARETEEEKKVKVGVKTLQDSRHIPESVPRDGYDIVYSSRYIRTVSLQFWANVAGNTQSPPRNDLKLI